MESRSITVYLHLRYALTLIDALDTLVIIGNISEFSKNIRWLEENLTFDKDYNVSVFETNIRILGGLLSAHFLATEYMSDYKV